MVQCDACQTWQHTKCYRVDFERLTKDSAAVWICIVCGPDTWTGKPLDSEWANRMQKKEEERERVAALTKQLDIQAARNGSGRKGRAGRKPGTIGAAGTIGPSSALAGSGATGITTDREEEVDEAESWRQVYVPSKQNIIEKDVRPHIRRFLSVYGPGSKFFAKALEANRGWTTPSSKGKGKEKEVTGYDILSRSLPIIVNADELASAENEEWVTVGSMHVPPVEVTPPISAVPNRSASPSASRSRMESTVPPSTHQPPSGPPALTVVTQNDFSYGNVFLLTVASNASAVDSQRPSNVPTNPPAIERQRHSKSPPVQRNAAKVAARNLSPPPQARTAISPTTARSRRITPVQPDEEEPPPPVFAGPNGVPKSDPFTAQKYTLHTSQRAPPRTLLACFPANVSSHSAYLATPSNQYFHLGAPKPHVRVLAAPLEVALDARVIGGIGRFARSGCWPNAALRTVVVKPDKRKRPKKPQRVDDDVNMDDDADDTLSDSLHFGIFSLRELAEGEEIVVGWEWDDAHRIHRLPKLLLEEARMLLERETASFS
jgi:PHD-finger